MTAGVQTICRAIGAALAVFAAAAIAAQSSQSVARPGDVAAPTAAADATEGTATVQGHVSDADGTPIQDARIVLTNTTTGRTRSEDTGEDGRYQFDKLPRGTYEASARKLGYVSLDFGTDRAQQPGRRFTVGDGESVGRIDFTLPRVGAIVGRVADENGDPVQGATASAYALSFVNGRRALVREGISSRTTDDLGHFRIYGLQPGRYVIAATAAPIGPYRLPGYVRGYYPGSISPADAQPVDLQTGDDVPGVEVRLTPGHSVKISGTAQTADGRPFTQRLTIAQTQRSSLLADAAVPVAPSSDGTFSIQNLSSGEYVLKASMFTPDGLHFAEQFVNADSDVQGLALQLAPGSRVSGRIVLEGDTSHALPRDFSFMFQSVDSDLSPGPGSFRAKINDDWTFEYSGLFGPTLIRPVGRNEWLLKSIRANGIDVTDTVITFGRREASLSGVEVTFTNRGAQLTASVVDGRGQPAATCNAIAFSTDRGRWERFTRFAKTARCDPDGTVLFRGLPGDEYFVIATDRTIGSDAGSWQDPAYLESLVPAAIHVTLTEGQSTSASLRLATAAR